MDRDTLLALMALVAGVTDTPLDRAWSLVMVDIPRIIVMKDLAIVCGMRHTYFLK